MNLTEETGLPAMETDLLAHLTEPQKAAVEHTEGPLLVFAAAGSGKTRVITRRIAYLISCGIAPWSILALTFTNKAAGEMRARVLDQLGQNERSSRGLTVTTFHSLCARLLRRYAEVAKLPGVKADFSIYDSADQVALMKKTIAALDLSTSNWPPRSVLSAISNAKNDLMDAAEFGRHAGDFYSRTVAKIYTSYEQGLRKAGAVDFDDLLLLTAKMLKESTEIRDDCRQRWQYLLIDEYQDTNHAQFSIAAALAGTDGDATVGPAGPNICVVGDPDQSIYGWRGADITNILEFEEHYPKAQVITLGQNFRSTAPILAVADGLIRHNRTRKHKDLFTTQEGGEAVKVTLCSDERHEASLIVDWFKAIQEGEGVDEPVAWKDMAVFYRTNALSRVMEDALRVAGIPYVIARGTAFFQREEIRNAISYLRLLANTADDVSFARVVNTPTRGIGKASLGHISWFAEQNGLPMLEAMRRVGEVADVSARAANASGKFVELIDSLTGSGSFMGAQLTGSLSDLVDRVIKESGLESMYTSQAATSKADADNQRLDNLEELVSSAAQFEESYDPASDPVQFPGADVMAKGEEPAVPPLLGVLRAYLESVALVADADAVDPAQGVVTLMTLHAAKGLEFPAVAMIGLEEGLLPHSRSRESEAMLEEERRLCFVGITRAMQYLQITSAKYRTQRGVSERAIPSIFLDELPREHVVQLDTSNEVLGGTDWEDADVEPRRELFDPDRTAGGSSSRLPVGAMVRHPQFGVGKVLSCSSGANARARIEFRDVGLKTLILEYARLERIG